MALGAATAPWLTLGFGSAVWLTRASVSLRRAAGVGVAVMAVYLFAWLLAYHAAFALRESVTVDEAWREAAPWVVVAVPACVVLGIAAATAHQRATIGDICLALPVAWSLPEITVNLKGGWSYALVIALPITALALVPMVAVDRRGVNLVRVAAACVFFGVAALALFPVARNYIHS